MFMAYSVFFLRLSNKPYVTQYRYEIRALIVAPPSHPRPPHTDWFIFNVVFFVNLFSEKSQRAIRWTSLDSTAASVYRKLALCAVAGFKNTLRKKIENETKWTKELYDALLGILMQWWAWGDSTVVSKNANNIENRRANNAYAVYCSFE